MTTSLSQFLARGIYYLHAILIFVLIFGWIIPNSPTLWIAFVVIIIASAVMYVLTGGCALNRYEDYFSGARIKNKFIQRLMTQMNISVGAFEAKAITNAAVIVALCLYAIRLVNYTRQNNSKPIGDFSLVALGAAAGTIAVCATAPTNTPARPEGNAHNLHNLNGGKQV